MSTDAKTRRSLPGPVGPWLGVCYLVLGAVSLVARFPAESTGRHLLGVLPGLGWVALGVLGLTLNRTSLDERGVRPAGRFRRIPWQHISSAYTTSSPARRGFVGLVVDERTRPVWIKDPTQLTVQRWTAATGQQAAAYGYDNSDNPPPTGTS